MDLQVALQVVRLQALQVLLAPAPFVRLAEEFDRHGRTKHRPALVELEDAGLVQVQQGLL
jgi:hypothetical protein